MLNNGNKMNEWGEAGEKHCVRTLTLVSVWSHLVVLYKYSVVHIIVCRTIQNILMRLSSLRAWESIVLGHLVTCKFYLLLLIRENSY